MAKGSAPTTHGELIGTKWLSACTMCDGRNPVRQKWGAQSCLVATFRGDEEGHTGLRTAMAEMKHLFDAVSAQRSKCRGQS